MIGRSLGLQLKRVVEKNTPSQQQFLKKLVKTKSVNASTPEKSLLNEAVEAEVAEVIYQKLASLGVSPRRLGASASRPNIVAYCGPARFRKSLIFNGHMDTTPPPTMVTGNPYSGEIRGGKLFGLGAFDMKASLSAYVYALKALVDCGVNLDGRLILEFVVDEEAGASSRWGTAYLISKGIRAKTALIAEPGPQIGIGHRGGYRFKLTTFGEAVHTGVSSWQKGEKGCNAIAEMVRAIAAIADLEIPYKPSRAFSGKKPFLTFPTLISGGTAINMVPDVCIAYGDVRLMPGNSHKQVRLLLEERLVKQKGLRYQIDDLLFVPAVEMDEKEEIFDILSGEFREVTHSVPKLEGIGPWNDAWMLSQAGIPTVTQVPLSGGNAHGGEEWVDLASLKQLTLVLARTALAYLGQKV